MSTIGTFFRKGNAYIGTIETITFTAEAKFVAIDTDSPKGPDFRIIIRKAECGAAWKQTSEKGNDYLSVVLDDPSFAAPIRANLVETNIKGEYALLWSRRRD